ncbi:MAG TPA: FecR domain-containing protein [Draconibacterium sp.]|nr:FecR domain-containing protein [Draconibacterium sp.]
MKKTIPWNIIIKHLKNQSNKEETRILESWLKEDKHNLKIFNDLVDVYIINNNIQNPFIPDKEKAWQQIESRISANPLFSFKLFLNKYKYVASIIVFLMIGSTILIRKNNQNNLHQFRNQYTEIISPLGQKTKVLLPDSSYVWLNSGSSLKYKSDFNLTEREVTLEGEAYFQVKKNLSKKFRVKSGILNIDVYGTAFNIKNHSNDQFQEITVSEGRVGVSDHKSEIRQLTIGDQARLNKETKEIVFTKSNPEVVSAWKNNELIFDNTPMREVVKFLERWYGVSIKVDEEMFNKHRFSFKIKTESFYEMLEKMKLIIPLEYTIDGSEVSLHYSK